MIAYFDCFSGASGDMILGSLIDAGLPLEELRDGLAGLSIAGEFSLTTEFVMRGALRATLLKVNLTNDHDHDHDHNHRHLEDIQRIIEDSNIPPSVKQQSLAIFGRLAQAEAHVHGVPIDHIHFHEVGAVDSIVDIIGAAWGLNRLGVSQVYASSLPLGHGELQGSHGTLPLPAPATLELLSMGGAPTRSHPGDKELVTPTGAAILTTMATFEQPSMKINRIGIGAGGRDLPWPNVLRVWLGEPLDHTSSPTSSLSVLETNIDNMNPEIYGHIMAKLFEAGALDVYLTPIQMKKNRPGTMLSVIARPHDEANLTSLMLRETSTLGVRIHPCYRYEVERQVKVVDTEYGPVEVKLKWLDGQVKGIAPEYESCRKLALEKNLPLIDVFRAALCAGDTILSA
jgi:pyridinium-3,5-bisthiocarboxylic acid mononucleotide nickel chelatase